MRKFRTNPGHQDTAPMLHLRARHGVAGYGVYIMLLNLISASPTRSIEADAAYLAYVLREDEALVKSVLFDFDLFTISDDGRTATSPLVTPQQPETHAADATPSDATRAADAVQMPMYHEFKDIVRRNEAHKPRGYIGEWQCRNYVKRHTGDKNLDIEFLSLLMREIWIFFDAKGIEGLGIDYIYHRTLQYFRYLRATGTILASDLNSK